MPATTMPRRIPVLLSPDDFATLATMAKREQRTPKEQATYLVRRSLATGNAGRDAPDGPDKETAA